MSLIKCPECNKEISNKAKVCIHCGYPISDFVLTDIDNLLYKIDICLKNININNEIINGLEQSYHKIEEYIEIFLEKIQSEEKLIEFNSKLLIMLYEFVENIVYYFTPEESYDLFSLVDFAKISDKTQKIFVEKIDNLLTKEGAFDDDCISNQCCVILWHPLFEAIKNFDPNNSEYIYEKLCEKTQKQKTLDFPSIMEYISTTAQKHAFMRRISEQRNSDNVLQEINIPKCPTCSSTKIHKISVTSKAINIGLFGIFGNKRKKQFHCDSCGYEW